MRGKRQRRLKFFKILLAVLVFWNTGPVKAQLVDKIIAKVDNEIVLKSDLDISYIQFLSQADPDKDFSDKDIRCRLLENLLINKLMLAKAVIDSVTVEPEMVQAQVDQRMDYFIKAAGSAEKLEGLYNKSIDELKDDLKRSLKEQLIVQKMQEKLTGAVKVTPGEVKKFYNNIPKDSLPYFSTMVEVAQIVKKPEIGSAEKREVIDLLLSIREQVGAGADFCSFASKYSQDPGSKAHCGELGFFKKGELVPEYEGAALNLKPGEFSEPIESVYGFHLIQLIERRANEFNTRHILIKPASSSKDFSQAAKILDSVRNLILNDSITFHKAANKFSEDKDGKSTGGFFSNPEGGYRISVEDMDPVIFFTIDTMKIGQISHPIRFKMEDGTEAMRVIYLHSRIPPHQANLKDDYQEIQRAALEHKKSTILNEWFDKTKGEVYIHLDDEYSSCNLLMSP